MCVCVCNNMCNNRCAVGVRREKERIKEEHSIQLASIDFGVCVFAANNL